MRMRPIGMKWAGVVAGALLLAGISAASACMDYRQRPTKLAQEAISKDSEKAKAAIAALRAKGPDGLAEVGVLLADVDGYSRVPTPRPVQAFSDIQSMSEGEAMRRHHDGDLRKRILAAVDAVAGQKDAASSGLYWYTDLDQARAVAKKEGKPILSLRLLGNLDTEFSCANSRFFRTVLYADDTVSRALRDRFVLHWASVRPVPKVTIDMGDGRVICRTVTGNSIHYVLDADGRTVDALPGLYGPKAFLRVLEDAETAERELRTSATDPAARAAKLAEWHAKRSAAAEAALAQDLLTVMPATQAASVRDGVGASDARLSPGRIEGSRAKALRAGVTSRVSPDEETWARIAALPAHADDARLGPVARAIVKQKRGPAAPAARAAGRIAVGKMQVEDPLLRLVANFERSVAEDTVRNEYALHSRIHDWFAAKLPEALDPAGPNWLNEKVYAELFLTPTSDPWLGLAPEDVYTALGANAE